MRASPRSTPATTAPDGAIWARYRRNTARHLIGIARELQHEVLRSLTDEFGHRGLRPSFGPLVNRVALAPRPMGELATALSVSPQACSQLVSAAARAGYVERRADPSDGRARVIALTDSGTRLVADAARVLRRIAADYAERIGADEMARFEDAAGRLFEVLAGARARTQSEDDRVAIGTLAYLSVEAQRTLMRSAAARGHDGLKMSHAQVLPLIGADGARVGALARLQRISRQAISATARELEGLGYLRREPDPRDRRGVVFKLTDRGERLIEDSVRALDELDALYIETIGRRRAAAFERGARALYEALGLEREIFETSTAGEQPLTRLAERLRRELGNDDADRLARLLTTDGGARDAAPAH